MRTKIISVSLLLAFVGCAEDSAKKKKNPVLKENVHNLPVQPSAEPQSSNGMLGSLEDPKSQNQDEDSIESQQTQSPANPLQNILSLLLGGKDANSLAPLLQQILSAKAGQTGSKIDANQLAQLQALLSASAANSGVDLNALFGSLPQGQTGSSTAGGINFNQLLQIWMLYNGGLKLTQSKEVDLDLYRLADLLASELKVKTEGSVMDVVCEDQSAATEGILSVVLQGERSYHATRLVRCTQFKVQFHALVDGVYQVHALFQESHSGEKYAFVDNHVVIKNNETATVLQLSKSP